MKLSRKSWHYKLTNKLLYADSIDWHLAHGKINLCPYIWAVVFACFIVGVALPTAAIIAAFILLIPLIWPWLGEGAIIGAIAIGGLEIGVLSHIWAKYRKVRYGSVFPVKKDAVPRPSSLLSLWLKAKHEKVCPMLEVDK